MSGEVKDRLIRQVQLDRMMPTIRFAIVWPGQTDLIRNCGWMELKDVNHPNVRAGVVEFLQEYNFKVPEEPDLSKWGEPEFKLRKHYFGFPDDTYSGIYFDIVDWLGKHVWESDWVETADLAMTDWVRRAFAEDIRQACVPRGIVVEGDDVGCWGETT